MNGNKGIKDPGGEKKPEETDTKFSPLLKDNIKILENC